MKIEELKKEYEKLCNEYVKKFVKKHGYEFDYWIADDVGGIASFIEQYYFNLSDIRYDLENKILKGEIFKWQDENVEVQDGRFINFNSYCMGLRVKQISKNINEEEI